MWLKTLDDIAQFAHDRVDQVRGVRKSNLMLLIEKQEQVLAAHSVNLPYYLAREYHLGNKSIEQLQRELGIERKIIEMVFLNFGIPKLTPSEAYARNKELGLGIYGLSTEEREAMWRKGLEKVHAGRLNIPKDPEVRKRNAGIAGKRSAELGAGVHGANKETREYWSHLAGTQAKKVGAGIFGKDEEGVPYNVVGGRRLAKLGKNPFQTMTPEKRSEIGKLGGQASYEKGTAYFQIDPEKRRRISIESGRRSAKLRYGIHDPTKRHLYLPTLSGKRADVPYEAKSMWEANIYRLLRCLGFQIETNVPVRLDVGEDREWVFKQPTVDFYVDFYARSTKGKEYWFELMAHQLEHPDGIEKIKMFAEQFPERKLIVIAGPNMKDEFSGIVTKEYYKLQKAFWRAVDDRTVGWEKYSFNIRTNPQVFAPGV